MELVNSHKVHLDYSYQQVSGDSDEELETRHADIGTRNRATGEPQEETKVSKFLWHISKQIWPGICHVMKMYKVLED